MSRFQSLSPTVQCDPDKFCKTIGEEFKNCLDRERGEDRASCKQYFTRWSQCIQACKLKNKWTFPTPSAKFMGSVEQTLYNPKK